MLLAHRFDLVCAVVEPGRAQQVNLLRRRRWLAWLARGYQVRRQRLTGRSAYRLRYFAVDGDQAARERVEVSSINAKKTRAMLAKAAPDVIVVCGTSIIQMETLGGIPAVNVHGGWLPHYKGNHGVYFAYERGDFEHIGASLHLVSDELDGGDLLDVLRPEIFPHDNDEHLYCRSVEVAALRLCERLIELEAGKPIPTSPQQAGGETFRHRDRTPQRELALWTRRRIGLHPVPRLHPPPEPDA